MNMIEHVARAICLAELPTDDKWEWCVPAARAAIEAMREPTTEMKFCGVQSELYGIEATWKAMIDAALKEE